MPSITGIGTPTIVPVDPAAARAEFQSKVIKATDFAQAVGTGTVLVEFFSYGCGFCRAAIPDVVAASKALAQSGVKTVALEVNDPAAKAIGIKYGLGYYPTFAVFKDGVHAGTFMRDGNNPVTADQVLNGVKQALKKAPVMNSVG